VCVLKGKDGKYGVRIAVDYRYLNKYCPSDAHPMPDISDLIQRVGQARYIPEMTYIVFSGTLNPTHSLGISQCVT